MLKDTLKKLNFSPSETTVYLTLLKASSYASRISADTGINRSNVYEALDRLVEKGVVSFVTKNKVKWCEAKPIDSLLNLLQQTEDKLMRTKEMLLHDIKTFTPPARTDPLEATIFVGKKGLRMLFDEMLEVRQPVSLLAAELQFRQFFGPYFELWHKLRAERGIRQRSIFPMKLKGNLKKWKLLQYKYIEDTATSPTTTILYGQNCLFIQWSKEPVAVKIQSPEITRSHQNYFDMLWKKARK